MPAPVARLATSYADALPNWLRRLEAATARLEDIASSVVELPQAVPALQQSVVPPPSGASNLSTSAATSSATTPAAVRSPAPAPAPPPEPVPESIEEFDNFIEQSVQKYANISKGIGGLIAEQVWRGTSDLPPSTTRKYG